MIESKLSKFFFSLSKSKKLQTKFSNYLLNSNELSFNGCIEKSFYNQSVRLFLLGILIIFTGSALALPAPTLIADATSNTVDNFIDITFVDDATWRAASPIVKIGTTALTVTTDYDLTAGQLRLKPSGLNALLTTSGNKSVTVEATGYDVTNTLVQAIDPGAVSNKSTATINTPLTLSTESTITCTAKDQYYNLVPVNGYQFVYDITKTSGNATTTEVYIVNAINPAITATNVNIAATTTTGVVTFTAILPGVVDAGDGISIQVQLVDGTTNVGFPFITATANAVGGSINVSALTGYPFCDATVSSGGILTSNGATQSIRNLIVEEGGKLSITTANTLTVGDITFKSNAANASFSTLLNGTGAITATGSVTYLKTIDDVHYYYMSFPCNVAVNNIVPSSGVLGTDWNIWRYDGGKRANYDGTTNWIDVTAGSTLYAKQGYVFGSVSGNKTLTIPLSSSIFTEVATIPVLINTGTAAVNHHGWNLVGQPFLSNFLGTPVNISENFLTVFNGSTYDQIANSSADLKPFTAYFVQVAATGNMTFNGTGDGRYLAPSSTANSLMETVKIVITTTTGTDNTNLRIDPSQSVLYQIGQDLEKSITTGTAIPQIYSVLGGVDYSFNGLPIESVQNLPISIYTQSAGTATFHTDLTYASGISHLLLTDNSLSITTDLALSDYTYTALAGTESSRFTITAQSVATSNIPIEKSDKPQIGVASYKLLVSNIAEKSSVRVVDALGRLVASVATAHSSIEIPVSKKGIYVVQIQSGGKSWSEKVSVQ